MIYSSPGTCVKPDHSPLLYYLFWTWPEHIEAVLRRLLWISLVEEAENYFTAGLKVDDHTSYLQWLIAVSPESPPLVLDFLAQQQTFPELLERIAENPRTWATTLAVLALSPFSQVRIAVAENPHTPPAILHMLSRDENSDVRFALAEDFSLPDDILQELFLDQNPYVSSRAEKTWQVKYPNPTAVAKVDFIDHGAVHNLPKNKKRPING